MSAAQRLPSFGVGSPLASVQTSSLYIAAETGASVKAPWRERVAATVVSIGSPLATLIACLTDTTHKEVRGRLKVSIEEKFL